MCHSEGDWERQNILSAFERGMVVGVRRTSLSVSRTATLLGFSCSTVSHVYREWSTTQTASSQQQTSAQKWLIYERGQRRLTQIVQSNRHVLVSQLTVQDNIGAKRPTIKCANRRTSTRMGYGSLRPYRVPLLSAKNKNLQLQWAEE